MCFIFNILIFVCAIVMMFLLSFNWERNVARMKNNNNSYHILVLFLPNCVHFKIHHISHAELTFNHTVYKGKKEIGQHESARDEHYCVCGCDGIRMSTALVYPFAFDGTLVHKGESDLESKTREILT